MISYVFLVVIAVGLAGLVYSFLVVYVPNERLTCPDEVQLVVLGANCYRADSTEDSTEFDTLLSDNSYCSLVANNNGPRTIINVSLQNKGLFSADYAKARYFSEGRDLPKSFDSKNNDNFGNSGILPNEIEIKTICEGEDLSGEITVEIQPGVKDGQNEALCDNIVKTKVTCS